MSKLGVNETAQYFEGILTTAHEGIVFVDQDGIILRVNPTFTKILGYEEKEILGKPFYILNFKDQVMKKGSSHSPLYRFYSSEKTSMEYGFFDKQGRDVTIRFRSFIMRDEHGQTKGAVGMLEHMVELTGTGEAGSSLAEKMWEAQQNFDNVLENSADAVSICDNRGNITMANKAFLKMLNYTQEEVIGKFIVEFTAYLEGTYATTTGEEIIIDEESVNNTGSISAELFEKGYIKNWETYFVRKDKVHVPVDATLSVLKDTDGQRRGSIVILRDITERRSAEIERKQDENKLKETKDHLDNIIESSLDSIIVSDEIGCISRVNKYFLELFGYRKEEVLGKHTMDLTPMNKEGTYESTTGELIHVGKEYTDNALAVVYKFLEEGTITNWENHYFNKDGKLVSIEQNMVCLYNKAGERIGAVAIIRDISERKRTEGELKKTKDHLDNIIESSLDGIIVGDSTGTIVRVNKSFLALIGYQIEEVLGKHIMELSITEPGTYESTTGEMVEINEDYFNNTRETIYEKLLKEGTLSNWESYYLNKNGKIVPVEQNISYLYSKEGDIIGSVGINRDITERKGTEKEIREAKEFLEDVFKTTVDGIMVTDRQGCIVRVNKAIEQMLGFREDEMIGKYTFELGIQSEESKKASEAMLEQLFKKGFVNNFEASWYKKDRSLCPVEMSISFIKDEEGNFSGSVGAIRDISKRKEMEDKLLQSEKLKSLGELAGGVAHDFNNVLAAILGRAQLLRMNVEPPPGKEERRKSVDTMKKGLEVIERAANDGAETVRRIQEFARRREEDKHFTTVDLNGIIDNALEFTKTRWKNDAESKGVEINIKKEFSTLPTTSGSASELREVFTNIINNSIDAMPQGGDIKIKTFKKDGHICIKVKDTGVGIAKDRKDRIFDPFFTTKGVQSTGLGMSVSYGIINRHRGTITVDSVEGQGTTFTIKLPIINNTIEEEKVERIECEPRKAKVLVIEDEEDVRDLLSDILIKGGHEVEMASDGNQGIEMFEGKEFDLVLTDLGMPGMSGWQVAEKIKNLNGRVPVALITGWNIELKEPEIKDKWVDLVIQKPFEMKLILNVVQEGMILRDKFKAA